MSEDLLKELRETAGDAGNGLDRESRVAIDAAADEIERLRGVAQGSSEPSQKDEMLAFFLAFFEGWPEGSKLTFTNMEALERARAKVAALSLPSPTQRPADCGAWQDIATAPGDANVLIDYDGVVVIGGFNAVSKEWTDGEDYIPLKDIRGWMPLPRTSRIPSTTRGGEA